jgi:hypothetical protein
MLIYINGFWSGFLEKTNAVHFGVFQTIFSNAFNEPVHPTRNIDEAECLLESHFGDSMLFKKSWKYSFYFSGEGDNFSIPTHSEKYTAVLGSQETTSNFVSLPLYLCYDFCRPYEYPSCIHQCPPKKICAIISNCKEDQYRVKLIRLLEENGIHVDMGGRYGNNIGYTVPGEYGDISMIQFQSQYRIVLALENTVLDNYITEKIINPLRAGIIPVYYGSPRINEYINSKRFVQITPDTFNTCIIEINRLLKDDLYWLECVNQSIFVKKLEDRLYSISEELKMLINRTVYSVELISNYSVEIERHEDIDNICNFFSIKPSFECWKNSVYSHPLFKKFSSDKKIGAVSLAINHITLFKKYANKDTYLVIFESDAIPLYPLNFIKQQIEDDIKVMKHYSIDFAFIGLGCFEPLRNSNLPNSIGPNLIRKNTSRCTESYIISPQGIIEFLKWFYNTENHDNIDWAFNHYLTYSPNTICCWRNPELFMQGTNTGKYISLVNN